MTDFALVGSLSKSARPRWCEGQVMCVAHQRNELNTLDRNISTAVGE